MRVENALQAAEAAGAKRKNSAVFIRLNRQNVLDKMLGNKDSKKKYRDPALEVKAKAPDKSLDKLEQKDLGLGFLGGSK